MIYSDKLLISTATPCFLRKTVLEKNKIYGKVRHKQALYAVTEVWHMHRTYMVDSICLKFREKNNLNVGT